MAQFQLNAIMTSVMNILFLGTGTSVGVPQIGCTCPVCLSTEEKNKRLRSSLLVEIDGLRILIDASPDLRQQALRSGINNVDAVLFTHSHVDHVGGFDDLRAFCWHREGGLPMYASEETMAALKNIYAWAFYPPVQHSGYVRPEPYVFTKSFKIGAVLVTPLPVQHGWVDVHGFMLDYGGKRIIYMPDVKTISTEVIEKMRGVDLLIIDGLRYSEHPTHLNVTEALEVIRQISPKRAILTHLSHEIDYQTLSAELPLGVEPAYDNLRISI